MSLLYSGVTVGAEIVADLRRQGFTLSYEGNNLFVQPKSKLNASLRKDIADSRESILLALWAEIPELERAMLLGASFKVAMDSLRRIANKPEFKSAAADLIEIEGKDWSDGFDESYNRALKAECTLTDAVREWERLIGLLEMMCK